LSRIFESGDNSNAEFLRYIANSFMLSVDNGHAVHPSHPEYSDPNNLVYLNKGPIIKFNSNMAYLSDAASSAKIIDLCKTNNIPYQIFYNKSDVRGGSTLGTLSVSHLGIQTCDIGLPQLAMHSSFETAGATDVESMYKLICAFYSMQ
jgi:aspartyl aminopeptidase